MHPQGGNTRPEPRASGSLPLIDASVSPATLNNYTSAVHLFLRWLATQPSSARSAQSSLDFDLLLVHYLHYLWRNGKGKQAGKNTVCGVALYLPGLSRRLHYSSRALRGWDRLVPSVPHAPMSRTVLRVVAVSMARLGWFSTAVGTLLAFECYLRVSELTNLRRSDVSLPQDPRLGLDTPSSLVALRIRKTKRGSNLWVTVRSPLVRLLLLELLSGLGEEDRVFNFSSNTFRRRLHRSCSVLGLHGYVPHSLRHGGATHDYLSGVPIEDVMVRGRWASVKSARHYVQQGRALLLANNIPAGVVAMSQRVRYDLYSLLHRAAPQ